ncbi:triple tyrosine motif-containing protein [Rufibacter sp. XAAS-G3-1]|uniref:triple tyrosine motif-containing protein n=1 Tax=Rufibacter sp. XAAS-G3-1 TaxID=2729134 RepID=UPI0015E77679|nr:triple tyrosine motif-containing protein [Rufibacter sp. XAAS-G3-1]
MKHSSIFWLIVGIVLWATPGSKAQPSKDLSFPLIQNYPKSLYQAGNQNWSVAQGRDRVMYLGNSEGLLAYDGQAWQLYRMPNKVIVRAVAADPKTNRVYAGGFGELGYWAYNRQGRFVYTSLAHLIPAENALKGEIWKIYVEPGRVIFQSFSAIYIYQQGKMQVVKGEHTLLFLLKARNRYFVEVIEKGLYELKDSALVLIKGSEAMGNTGVLSVLPFQGNSFLIGTAKSGLFLFDGTSISPWGSPAANDFLKTNQLNNGVVLQNQTVAYGTILNGLVILNQEGKILHRMNKAGGLQNNTVLSLFTDRENNLWAGLDNGVDRIEVNSPLYFYFDKTGTFGTVYSSIIHQGKIYLGTNQGLFYSDWAPNHAQQYQSLDFRIIEGSQGQVWELTLQDGQLLCGHNEGTFRVEGDRLQKLSGFKGGWTLKKLTSPAPTLLQGTYTGLVVYKKDAGGKWVVSHRIEGFGEPSRFVEQDNTGHIWVSHAYRGLYKLTLSADMTRAESVTYYNQEQGLPADDQINVFRLNGRAVFTSEDGFYGYDAVSDSFSKYTELNKKLGAFASSNRIIQAAGTQYWFINHGRLALVDMPQAGTVRVSSTPFNLLSGHMVQYYENISRISKSSYLISIDDGFAVYNTEVAPPPKKTLPPVLIRKVQHHSEARYPLAETNSVHLEIPYKRNSLSIAFSLPYYSQMKPKFQYFLEGYSKEWSDWAYASQKEFLNLAQGNYRFLVRAKIENEATSPVTAFRFTVGPPWYATYWAYLGYVVVGLLLLLLFRHLYHARLHQDKERIRLKLEQEKEEHLRREAIVNEQKLVKLRNEQLESELAVKSRELANSALNIVSKNELLEGIRQEILLLKDASGKKLSPEQLKKLQKVIDEGIDKGYDWNLFESSFNEAHENYFKKLKTLHPELTPKDLKLCAYLRLNMNSKEIASLLNITVRSVEISRYRLRKKLNLDHEKNLVEFLMEV